MPFIAQCPHDDCRKFMLLEDDIQGAVIQCLVCKQAIELDGAEEDPADDDDEIVDLQPVGQKQRDTSGFHVRNCPKCGIPLRIPYGQENQAVQCTECEFWGIVSG